MLLFCAVGGSLCDFLQFACDGVDDEATDGDVFGNERMGLDGLDGFADGGFGVSEAFEPMIKVDATFADGVERFVLDTAHFHDMVKMRVTHVTGAALGMGDHHDLLYAEFIDGDYQAAHGGVEGRDDESAGILDDLGIAVLETERCGEKFGQTRVHAGEYRQFFVGVLVGDVLLVAFLRHEIPVKINDLVYHNRIFYRDVPLCKAALPRSVIRPRASKSAQRCRFSSVQWLRF